MYTYIGMRDRKGSGEWWEVPVPATARLEKARNEYLRAWRWRRVVEEALRISELTFTQWLVLDGTARSVAAARDAVSQSDVARRIELDRMTVSQVIRTLVERGLVDRGPSASGPALRLILTRKGRQVLLEATEAVRGLAV